MLKVIKNVGFWFIFPYIAIVIVPICLFIVISGGGNALCVCLAICLALGFLANIVIGTISLFLSNPLPIIILLQIKLFFEILISFVTPIKK